MQSGRKSTRVAAAVLGVASALAVLGVAELVAAFVNARSSPLFAVGSLAIDLAPSWVKDTMISLFGTADKVALFVILGIVLLALAVIAGIAELARRWTGVLVLGVVSAVALIAILTRTEATFLWALPTVIGAFAGFWVLHRGRPRALAWGGAAMQLETAGTVHRKNDPAKLERRSFLLFVGATSAAAIVIGVGARVKNASSAAYTAVRSAIRLPNPAQAAPAVPAAASLDATGISPLITPNADFYRIDIALQVPRIDPSAWELQITGMVDTPMTITYDELLALPLEEHITTIACVSNTVGGDLIGNATWLGYPIRELLQRAGVASGADMVLSSGPDGFTAGTPIEALTDPDRNALLAVGMNGEPLPAEHGFPARLIVPGLYGYVSATKWVTRLEVTRFADAEGYWTPRGWSELGPIKTASRIDTPRSGAKATGDTVAIAGVAWAQHTGIAGVEVQVHDGDWQQATLATAISDDTWVQWTLPWSATPGRHTARVRATDASGYTQTSAEAPPAPNGATGWHSVDFTV
ncbi:molybdopterin-dependent oxidoreductase [Leucobacter sp. NPDC077196]|uniref:molybdopterin-dependent oxidoreductase n=1 Tax=Leucobacter sp. NPDC077196 TaxID=3154959 RepID=UPI00341F9183